MRRRNEFSEVKNTDTTLKSLLIKIFLILVIILVLVWLIPKFFLYKNSKTHEEIKEDNKTVVIKDETVNNLENAGVKFFNEQNTPKNNGDKKKVTLKELQDKKLIGVLKDGNNTCDTKSSYVELIRKNDEYMLKSNVKCSDATKNKVTYLNNYKYCDNSYLCARDLQKEKQLEEEEKNRNIQVPSTGVDDNEEKELTEFGPWKNYHETSCDRQEIKCDINNTNCLREVRIQTVKVLADSGNQIYKNVCYMSERTREYK